MKTEKPAIFRLLAEQQRPAAQAVLAPTSAGRIAWMANVPAARRSRMKMSRHCTAPASQIGRLSGFSNAKPTSYRQTE
jgi:hypothetical protein